ncbi:MAG: FAD-binding protein [Pelagimonas sp.]|nr:FAD-binding protein [Pelagimonas sp.]
MRPESEAELAEMIAAATDPLRILGGGTRPIGRVGQGNPLETSGMAGITLFEPGALTMVAQAGTPLTEIEAALDAEGQRLAFEPMDHRTVLGIAGEPTIGGVVAGNISGPRRIQVGACRDFALGVRFVDGSGHIIKNGGRVMKNVTGYDLVKLMAGSWGTLGVMSEVSLKTQPKPETQATLVLEGVSPQQAVAALSQGLTSPYQITGAAYDTKAQAAYLRIEGFEGSVAYRMKQLIAMFPDHAHRMLQEPNEVDRLWRDLRDVIPLTTGDGDIWKISCKPSDAPDLLARMNAAQTLLDWGGGLIWARLRAGTDLRSQLGAYDGHATLIRASDTTRQTIAPFQSETPALALLTQGLRQKFDPKGILNPGLMG